MTNITERLEIINASRSIAINAMNRKGFAGACEDVFVAIDFHNQVRVGNISVVETAEVKYILAIAGLNYYEGFVKRLYQVYLMLDHCNQLLNRIDLDNWSLHVEFNLWGATGYIRPNGIMSLNRNPHHTIEFAAPALKYFQDIWDFFLKINAEFEDYKAAKRYRDSYLKSGI